jgi:hypothetical protein
MALWSFGPFDGIEGVCQWNLTRPRQDHEILQSTEYVRMDTCKQ